ncbi:Hok/Gef family protein [Salmonella enterica subsp. enterica]|nr:Hok/Gef family protein [Salmonella enterica]ELH8384340.1 Hok/Gef family protein [Salmonella enterica subsp. enterica]HAK6771647.1 Hok/Gef family protein [Salmonella enterica]HAK6818073.1 Hok/Gef family protein [Salmonella enterica]
METDFYLLAFTFLTRKLLYEIRFRDGDREVAAFIAYESGKLHSISFLPFFFFASLPNQFSA